MAPTPHTIRLAAVFAAAALFAAPAAGADAQAEFDKLFGPDLARVAKTADTADDMALAKTLLGASDAGDVDDDMARILLTTAHKLAAASADGQETAAAAAQTLAERDPSQAAWALSAIKDAREKAYRAARGDDRAAAGSALIDAMLALADHHRATGEPSTALDLYRKAIPVATAVRDPRLGSLRTAMTDTIAENNTVKKIESIKAKLSGTGGDQAELAKQLTLLYVTELDQPEEARKYTFLTKDQKLSDRVRLAAADPSSLEAAQHIDLATWYDSLAPTAGTARGKLAVSTRALNHYRLFAEAGEGSGIERAKAKAAIGRLEEVLAAAEPAAQPAAGGPATAAKPKARYEVTGSAHLLIRMRRWLGDRLWDRFLAGNYPRPGA